MWSQGYDPFGSMVLSTAVAAIPVVVLPPELFQSIYFPTLQDPKWFEVAKPASEHPSVRALQRLSLIHI